jgi:hypothetical protein
MSILSIILFAPGFRAAVIFFVAIILPLLLILLILLSLVNLVEGLLVHTLIFFIYSTKLHKLSIQYLIVQVIKVLYLPPSLVLQFFGKGLYIDFFQYLPIVLYLFSGTWPSRYPINLQIILFWHILVSLSSRDLPSYS